MLAGQDELEGLKQRWGERGLGERAKGWEREDRERNREREERREREKEKEKEKERKGEREEREGATEREREREKEREKKRERGPETICPNLRRASPAAISRVAAGAHVRRRLTAQRVGPAGAAAAGRCSGRGRGGGRCTPPFRG